MTDILRRKRYVENRVLIETARILNPQFKSTILYVSGAQLEVLRNLMEYLNRRTTFASEYFNRYYLSPTAEEWDSLLAIVADLEEKLMLIYVDDYVCVRDKKAQDTDGGTFTEFSWETRDINDEQSDTSGICSLGSNQITLAAGSYRCLVVAPALQCDVHQARLWNETDSVVLIQGTSQRSSSADRVTTCSLVVGHFVLATEKTLEVQHHCSSTKSVSGFGEAAHVSDEIYTVAEFWRMIG